MMGDASDGYMDGMMGGAQIVMGGGMMTGSMMGGPMMEGVIMPHDAFTGGMANAMEDFINSPMNRSGVTVQDMQTLIDKLYLSDGVIVQ